MSDYDLGEDYMDESPSSEDEYVDGVDDSSEDLDASLGEINDGSEEGDESPRTIPYERFKQSRQQYRSLKDEHSTLKQSLAEMNGRFQAMEEYNQHIYSALQQQQTEQTEEDPFADPLEARVTSLTSQIEQLSSSLQGREHEMLVSQEETKIRRELQAAKKRFPRADELFILDGLSRNPTARVLDLARKSESLNSRRYQRWASEQGFKPQPRRLVPGNTGSVAKPEEIGDDLDKAESAAIQYLLAMQE